MSNNIYGGITYPGTGLVFDKIYDNYNQATTNTEGQNSGPQRDNVMNGRYILIKYCERAFSHEEKRIIERESISGETAKAIFDKLCADGYAAAEDNIYKENVSAYCANYLIDKYSFDRTILRKVYKGDAYQYEEIGKIESAIPMKEFADTLSSAEDLRKQLNNLSGAIKEDVIEKIQAAASIIGSENAINAKGFPIVEYRREQDGYYYIVKASTDLTSIEIPTTISIYLQYLEPQEDPESMRYDFITIGEGQITHIKDDKYKIKAGWYSVKPESENTLVMFDDIQNDIENNSLVDLCSWLCFTDNAQSGDYIVSKGAISAGINNQAIGEGSFTSGKENKAVGAYSAAFGRGNQVAYDGAVFGRYNQALGQMNTIFGQHNTINGYDSVAFGVYNNVESGTSEVMVAGIHNTIESNAINGQFVVGQANDPVSNALFIVGNGECDRTKPAEPDGVKSRSNAFEVHADGSVIIGSRIKYANGQPISSDVINSIKYLMPVDENITVWTGKQADATVWNKKNSGKGGTPEQPILISSGEELLYFLQAIQDPIVPTASICYLQQTNNIYLNDILQQAWYEDENKNSWPDIELINSIHYDGQGYAIYGLTNALFGTCTTNNSTITIKNLHLSNCYMSIEQEQDTDNIHIGGFFKGQASGLNCSFTFEGCGIDNSCTIKSAKATIASNGTITNPDAGGFIGYLPGTMKLTITNCYSTPKQIEGKRNSGLFLGNHWCASNAEATCNLSFSYAYYDGAIPLVKLDGGSDKTPVILKIKGVKNSDSNDYSSSVYYNNAENSYISPNVVLINENGSNVDPQPENYIITYTNRSLTNMPNLQGAFKENYGYILPTSAFRSLDFSVLDNLLSNISYPEGKMVISNLSSIETDKIKLNNHIMSIDEQKNDILLKGPTEEEDITIMTRKNLPFDLNYAIKVVKSTSEIQGTETNTIVFVLDNQ